MRIPCRSRTQLDQGSARVGFSIGTHGRAIEVHRDLPRHHVQPHRVEHVEVSRVPAVMEHQCAVPHERKIAPVSVRRVRVGMLTGSYSHPDRSNPAS